MSSLSSFGQKQKNTSVGIENLRVLAIFAIVKHHSLLGYSVWSSKISVSYLISASLTNYGSILFMIISGYLFEKTSYKYPTAKKLAERKIFTILLPSLPFIFVWYLLVVFYIPSFYSLKITSVISVKYFLKNIYYVIFFSKYWFIFNLFLIQAVNSFIKNITKLPFLIILSVFITLFYSVNIYTKWISTSNSAALLAYYSFFFLGRLSSIYYATLSDTFNKFFSTKSNMIMYVLFMIIFFTLSVFESVYIQNYVDKGESTNILRISNIVFSLLLIIILFTIRHRFTLTKFFKAKNVFLIYLIHPILELPVELSFKKIASLFHQDISYHGGFYILIDLVYAVLTIILSLFIAHILLKNSYFKSLVDGKLFQRKEIKPSMELREKAL